MFCWLDRPNTFWPKLTHNVGIAIENYSIYNWMKSCTDDPYAISDYKSHFIWQNVVINVLPIRLTILSGKFLMRADHLEWEVLDTWLLYSGWATKISILNIGHAHFLFIVFETDWRAVLNPIQFQILSLITYGQNIVISVLLIRLTILNGKFFCAGLTILNGKPLVLDYYILVGLLLKYWFWISDTVFWRRLLYDMRTATENYSIWNWLKSFTDPYAFSDFKSHFIWPEYCNQCLADKTDHLEWEVFNAGLTILNRNLMALDYYILVGLLKYWYWIFGFQVSCHLARILHLMPC